MPFSVVVRKNNIGQVQADITDRTLDAVRESAHFTQGYAQQIAPVRTGAFHASIYVNGPNNESDYPQAAANAEKLNNRAIIQPEQQAANYDIGVKRLRDALGRFSLPQAIVSSAVDYAIFIEEGRHPRPTLRPAALVTENDFKGRMNHVADGY